MAESKTTPTWGYSRTEAARIFDLAEGEKLPEGWQAAPHPGRHPHDQELGIGTERNSIPASATVEPPISQGRPARGRPA